MDETCGGAPKARTVIISGSRHRALQWCRENDVAPYAKTTLIFTREAAVRGHAARATDRVVNLGTPGVMAMYDSLRIAGWAINA